VLLIVDPIVSAVAGDSHKNGETRRSLQPLVDLAGDVKAALLGVTHFSKGTSGREPIERITGSIAFGALARVVMVAAKEPEAEDGTAGRRILARAKSNIGPDEGGFAYSLELVPMPGDATIEASVAVWGERIDGTARDMLAVAESSDDGGEAHAFNEAKDSLLDFLMDGPKPAKECKAAISIDARLAKMEAKVGGTSWLTQLSDAELYAWCLAIATAEHSLFKDLPGDNELNGNLAEDMNDIACQCSNYPDFLAEMLDELQTLGAPKAAALLVEAVKAKRLSAPYLWADWRKGLSDRVLAMAEDRRPDGSERSEPDRQSEGAP